MARYAFLEGQYVLLDDAKVSVLTHAFLYGTAVFEGIRGYWVGEENTLYIFRLREHYERLLRSCRILSMKPQYSAEELSDITIELLSRNQDRENMYIRPIYYKAAKEIGPKLDGLRDDFLVFAVPMGDYLDVSKGLRVKVSSWRHVNENMIPMRAKVNGGYVNAALAKSEVLNDGYDEAIFLTHNGEVSEGSAENLFIVRDGKLITPPLHADLLEGITRSTVLDLARSELGIDVSERSIGRSELYVADEAFFSGTGAQISPIAEIDRRVIGDGNMGPITAQLQKLYFDAVRNKLPQYRQWCTPVHVTG